jgi:hypothetical protein
MKRYKYKAFKKMYIIFSFSSKVALVSSGRLSRLCLDACDDPQYYYYYYILEPVRVEY